MPILPMGTIVTVCMLIGLLFSVPYALKDKLTPLPKYVALMVGAIVFVAGAWNTFWHGLQNMDNFWGVAALVSGLFMMLAALYIMQLKSLPASLYRIRPIALTGLLVCFLMYAITLFRI